VAVSENGTERERLFDWTRGDRHRRSRWCDVRTIKAGDLVVMPFAFSDGTCVFCRAGLHTSCIHGGFFGTPEVAGAQAEAVRIPLADGTLFVLPTGKDDALMPSLLTLSDVMGTGHHAAVIARVGPRKNGRRRW
jgi:threonine dehydrogenase-like Zn-dependent dehydrogenase